MGVVVAGLLASAVVKIACGKLNSAIMKKVKLAWNFNDDLEDMKDIMESMAAVFEDAEKRSVKEKSVQLWLKRIKDSALDISDMMDDYEDTAKVTGILSSFPNARKKMALANKMKKMRKKLRKINQQGQSFKFKENTTANHDQQCIDERETMSDAGEAIILGRDAEKKDIIDILSASRRVDGTMVLPIYGLGGIGKSTMAQLVYNDTQLKQYYDHRVWVYVSEVFDLKKIGRSIISLLATDGGCQNLDTLETTNKCLKELLPADKKILVILDDIWQEDDSELNKLKGMLHKKGSMVDVLVTTRSESIANKICTSKPYMLQPLPHNVCWEIIKILSHFEDKSSKPKLEQIGLDIAKKCGGVALAAQVLGNMLKEEDLDGWSRINKDDIWNESFGGDEDSQHKKVLPSLRLSFERMAPTLRLCFSYCAIFPKGHAICEDDLVYQWIALDFVKEPYIGMKYINRLLGMSFLQHSKLPKISRKNVMWYTMHDLVHDLARSVIGDELNVIDASEKVKTSKQKYYRYALLLNYDGKTKLSNIVSKKVWALHFSSSSKSCPHNSSFSFAKHLRILDFSQCGSIILPSSIGQLKQLRCLIAPELQNKSLPDVFARLSKLQYLILSGSSQISALPGSIGKLNCLMYLNLSGCSGISEVPDPHGALELKSLVHLDMSNCSRITSLPSSLGNLTKLQHLDLSRCSGLKEIPESLGSLNNLQYLNLSYCNSFKKLPESIGSLNNLQYLFLESNGQIKELPGSFQNLQNLVHLDLSSCRCAKGLPEALHGLSTLAELNMYMFRIDPMFQKHVSDAIGNLINLKSLNIQQSEVSYCLDFIGTLTNLEYLCLSWNNGIESLPESIGNLKNLHTLDLSACDGLMSLPDSIGKLKNLQVLDLSFCVCLMYLPDSIGNLKNLHRLHLEDCQMLESLPDSISEITVLKHLSIEGCSDELIELANSKMHYSLTLPLFKVRADVVSTSSNLPLLKGVNMDALKIVSLERVRSLGEAHKVKLSEKDKLLHLRLVWTSGSGDRFVDDEDLLGQLLPPRCLEKLNLEGYSGQSFPSWFMDISRHLPNLVTISLDALSNCNSLPPLGQLPNLEMLFLENCNSVTKIGKDFCGGKGAFRLLSTIVLRNMQGLEMWCTTYSVEDGMEQFMFPMLDNICIVNCPRLRLTSRLPVCRKYAICQSNQVISSMEELGNDIGHLTPYTQTTILSFSECDCQSLRLFHHFTFLQELIFYRCNDMVSLPENMRHLTSLETLKLDSCDSISALPEWLRDLSSLKSVTIKSCKDIKSLPLCIRELTKLQKLWIEYCPELERWCKSEENKKKLADIDNIIYLLD